MRTLIIGAWRVVLERAGADWLILSTALLTALAATSLLASAPIYANATAEAGLRRALQAAPAAQGDLAVSADVRGADFAQTDARVRAAFAPILAKAGGSGARAGTSESFALPDQTSVSKLAAFAFFDRLQDHARLVAGSWPQAAAPPYPVAIPEPVAAALDLRPDQKLILTDRLDTEHQVPIEISGIYRVSDAHDPYWFGDDLATSGVRSGSSFTTYGPFVVTPDVFFGAIIAAPATVQWRLFPNFGHFSIGNARSLRDNIGALKKQFNGGSASFAVTTTLDQIISASERSLQVTQATVVVLMIQLVILAAYALGLTAGLLADQRRAERGLLAARGAPRRDLVALALAEALLLAVPATLAGPWLAAGALRLFNLAGPLAPTGLRLVPQISVSAVALAVVGGLICVAALVWPSLVQSRSTRSRQDGAGLTQQARLDVALLLVAGLGYWQLKRYGAPLTQGAQGTLGVDPLLIAAPALGLLAGAIFALRFLPLLARLADRAARRSRRLVLPLSAWEVARRPRRYARSGLLLMLALGIGLFSLAYARTWTRAQADQAAYQAGADLRVSPDLRPSASLQRLDLAGAYGAMDGVERSLPVARLITPLPQSSAVGRLLLLDSAHAAAAVQFRPDLAGAPLANLMARLSRRRPNVGRLPLPGTPRRIALDLQAVAPGAPVSLTASIVLRDASGILYPLQLGSLPADGASHTLSTALTSPLPDGQLASPDAPLDLVQINLATPPQPGATRSIQLTLERLAVSSASAGGSWQTVAFAPIEGGCPATAVGCSAAGQGEQPAPGFELSAEVPSLRATSAPPHAELGSFSPERIALTVATGAVPAGARDAPPTTFALRPAGMRAPPIIPVIVSDRLLALTGARDGDTLPLQLGAEQVTGAIVGSVHGFPTVDAHTDGVIVADLSTVSIVELLSGAELTEPTEYWLKLAPAAPATAARLLRQPPYSSDSVVSRTGLAQQYLSDPVALGTLGALTLGFLAAIIVASLGFAVSAVVSVRERLPEFATLRALGLSVPQLAGWLSIEQGALLGLSLAGGAVLGLGLAWLILPLLALRQDGGRIFPNLIVVIPWAELAALVAGIISLLLLAVAILTALLRHLGVASVLRTGSE